MRDVVNSRGGSDFLHRIGDSFFDAGGHFSWSGVIAFFLVLALIGLLVYLATKGRRSLAVAHAYGTVPVAEKDTEYFIRILKENYAKGQITDEDFQRKVQILRENE